MAVIKCSNCENEILDTEIVCPYCDCPVSATKTKLSAKNKAQNMDETKTIPAFSFSGEEKKPQTEKMEIATSADFVKEQAALQKGLHSFTQANAPASEKVGVSFENKNADSDHTAKEAAISEADVMRAEYDDDKTAVVKPIRHPDTSYEHELIPPETADDTDEPIPPKKKGGIIVACVLGALVITVLIFILANSIIRMFSETKETVPVKKTDTASSAEEGIKFTFKTTTLTISGNGDMMDYAQTDSVPWKEHLIQTKHIEIKKGVTHVGSYSFSQFTELEDVVIADTVKTIGEGAFYGCTSLESVTLPKKLTDIDSYAFTGCSSLESITLPQSVKKIGEGAFKSCTALEKVEIPEDTAVSKDAFFGCSHDFTIYCAKDSSAYDYAKENGITIKLTSGEEDEEEAEKTDEEEKTTDEKKAEEDSSNNKTTDKTTASEKSKQTDKTTDKAVSKTPSTDKNKTPAKDSNKTTQSQTPAPSVGAQSPNTPQESTPAQQQPQQQPSASSGNKDLSALMDDLQKAKTQAEKDQILSKIDEATK